MSDRSDNARTLSRHITHPHTRGAADAVEIMPTKQPLSLILTHALYYQDTNGGFRIILGVHPE